MNQVQVLEASIAERQEKAKVIARAESWTAWHYNQKELDKLQQQLVLAIRAQEAEVPESGDPETELVDALLALPAAVRQRVIEAATGSLRVVKR